MNGVDRLCSYLEERRVTYHRREHALVFTAREIADLERVSAHRVAKVVMAMARGSLVMLVLPAQRRVDLGLLATAMGTDDVRLAHEEEFTPRFPDCDPGAMPPFGNLYDIPVYADVALTNEAKVTFQAGTHTETLTIDFGDFERLVEPVIASFAEPACGDGA